MSTTKDLASQTISQLARAIKQQEISPVELTQHMLQRVERLNPTLKAFNTLTAEQALQFLRQPNHISAHGLFLFRLAAEPATGGPTL